jgi:hypothetical protein
MAIQFKFREDAPADERVQLIRTLQEKHGPTVRPLFPGDNEPELAALYRVEGVAPERVPEVLALLRASKYVDFAESDARRGLIR